MTPRANTAFYSVAEPQALLNIIKRRNCQGTHGCEPVPSLQEVSESELIFALSKL